MLTYYQLGNTFGYVDDPVNVPPGATIISQATYDGLVAAQQTQLDNDAAAQLNQRKADYTTVYAALRSMGMPQAAATLLAQAVGDTPAVDPELNVKAMTQQQTATSFTRNLTGADNAWEKVTEVADLVVEETGLYKISWAVRGSATIPSDTLNDGIAASALTFAGIGKNGVIIAGTETTVAFVSQGNLSASIGPQPAMQVQETGAGETYQILNSGDVIALYAGRVATNAAVGASTHTINAAATTGRTRIAIERVRPA